MQEWSVETFFKSEVIHNTDFAKRTCKVCGFTFSHHGMIDGQPKMLTHIKDFHIHSDGHIILPEGDHDSSECKHEFNGQDSCVLCGHKKKSDLKVGFHDISLQTNQCSKCDYIRKKGIAIFRIFKDEKEYILTNEHDINIFETQNEAEQYLILGHFDLSQYTYEAF